MPRSPQIPIRLSSTGPPQPLSQPGTYRISGTIADGDVVVDAGDSAVVQLILDNADITNTDGAAIAVTSAETAIVILADGSTNTLTDGAVYVLAEGEDEPNAALYSKSDLTITGEGSLVVSGNYNDGIASKDGLVIESGDITVVAVDDAIRGKDYVVVNGGNIDLTAGGDGIKSDNDEDPERRLRPDCRRRDQCDLRRRRSAGSHRRPDHWRNAYDLRRSFRRKRGRPRSPRRRDGRGQRRHDHC